MPIIYGSVYLAGPIGGGTIEQAIEWRDEAAYNLAAAGIVAISPLRAKRAILRSQFSYHDPLPMKGIEGHPLTSDKGITTRDRDDVMRSNLILMNLLGATRVSIGTMIEAGWAIRQLKKLTKSGENVFD